MAAIRCARGSSPRITDYCVGGILSSAQFNGKMGLAGGTHNYLAWYVNSAGTAVTGKDCAATHDAVVGGTIFVDTNGNSVQDATETPASGVEVYLDANNNGQLDANERWWVTGSSGAFTFLGVTPGQVTLRLVPKAGYTFTSAVDTLTLVNGQSVFNVSFAVQTAG